jgi:hypothetical protein
MSETQAHWTARSPNDFEYSVRASFYAQLDVSDTHRHLSLLRAIKLAAAKGLKVALVAYDDGDAANNNGPVNGQIFARCWEKQGRPTDFFELGDAKPDKPQTS